MELHRKGLIKRATGDSTRTLIVPPVYNDLPSNLQSTARLFADDCVISVGANTQKELDILQEDLHHLEN